MVRIEMYKATKGEWHPPYYLQDDRTRLVRVSMLELGPKPRNPAWRVCAWGADDFGMERDFEDREEAEEMFLDIATWAAVEEKLLRSCGFVRA